MSTCIKIAIIGFGNVARGIVTSLPHNPDIQLGAIFSRNPERVKNEIKNNKTLLSSLHSTPVYATTESKELKSCDVALLCGGSKNDLPIQGPQFAQYISTVDSFDNHSKIPEYFAHMHSVAQKAKTVSIISAGWDPGTFSLERLLASIIIPNAKTYGFYGLSKKGGLSMGHSDAIRSIEGVLDARQYTHAKHETIENLRAGKDIQLSPGNMHWRECFVVAKEGANQAKIKEKIKTMPGYFAPYETKVHFVSAKDLAQKHNTFPHDGLVIGKGTIGTNTNALVEYRNVWESNPTATAHILVAHARAAVRLYKEGKTGAFTILDIPPAYLSPKSQEEILKQFV